ncbi:tRNA-uridine aminocarboxypropyltransferase [Sandaracinus amylolyticus]|uniref:tRNA-uridine aminocarboxypropyltransferase n=1 Tax=Sandaracinus amylolyticus TaxID=927083 RepID=A0A0F6YLD9_9BACT|nr:tRNA-uridine aminocarboxypropyltransferase [Sandaracinus amylolyticus]AKF09341.1 DTW domain protein [Sandaracinus amylolyticus]
MSEEHCEKCGKPRAICVCDRVVSLPTTLRVLVLRHPQEDDAILGTAPLLAASLPSCEVRTGLSWASLAHALDREDADPTRWAVVYPTKIDPTVSAEARERPVLVLDRKGRERDADAPALEGIVVLDGTWSQAKALWWRNPWLLKLSRVVLRPREPSIYGRARKEPRREYVSTLEAVADVLPALGEPETTRDQLRRLMRTMVQRYRDQQTR